jgi:hypothetical protein
MSESKLFYIVCSTLFIYGLSSLLQLGSFVLPLPFFETALLIICLFLATKVWRTSKGLVILLILFGIFQFMALDYNYALFLSDQQLEKLSNSIVTDICKIIAHLLLVPILLLQNRRWTFISNRFELILYSAILLISLFLPSSLWLLLPSILISRIQVKKDALFQNSASFWLYLPLFILARELSLYFL